MNKVGDPLTKVLTGDINIDSIKFGNEEDQLNYLTNSSSNRHSPYITWPSRLTDFPTTCIHHIFYKIYETSFYECISCHFRDVSLRYDLSLIVFPICKIYSATVIVAKFNELMSPYDKNSLYAPETDRYSAFISVIKQLYMSCLPLVPLSRKRTKDKPCITNGLNRM